MIIFPSFAKATFFILLTLTVFVGKGAPSLQNYLEEFPLDTYQVYHVENQGYFYIDDIPDLIKDFLKKGIVWEGNIKDLLSKHIKPGSIAIDAGAHIGTHTIAMARYVGNEGTVWAFEPQRKIYRELVKNLQLNGIKNVQTRLNALGNEEKLVGIGKVPLGNEAATQICSCNETLENEVVDMITLDSLNLSNVSLIKIDVEHSEDLVLEGARETIKRNRPAIIIEICGGYNVETAPDEIKLKVAATRQKLQEMNYTIERVDGHNYLALPIS